MIDTDAQRTLPLQLPPHHLIQLLKRHRSYSPDRGKTVEALEERNSIGGKTAKIAGNESLRIHSGEEGLERSSVFSCCTLIHLSLQVLHSELCLEWIPLFL